jgi:alpha-mannosidase
MACLDPGDEIIIPEPAYANYMAFAISAGAEIKTVEQGAVHKTVRVRTHYGASTLTVDWMLCAGSRRVEARAILDWHEQLKLLKFSFPTGLENPVAAYETAYGSITRPANGDEEPGHRWVSLDGVREGRAAGLAIINDAKYGYSTPGPEIRVSVARGAPYALHRKPEPGVDYLWMDQGVQTLRMLLIPHDGAWGDARLTRAAEEFTAPVPVIFQGIHPGVRAQSDSFLSIDADNITIAAIKLAEDNDDLVLRCHETEGRPADAAVRLHFAGKTWNGHFRPHELKTLRFNRSTGTFREASLLEE